ncbi:MAG: YncE family protein [Janthinobacterium lividum]
MERPRAVAAVCLLPLLLAGGCHRMRFPQVAENYREYAYVTNGGAGTVSVLDLVNFRPDRTLRVGDNPTGVAVNPVRNEAYVVNTASGTVSVIDTATNTVTATMQVHKTPSSISVDSKGERAYVANSGSNTVSVLDLQAHREVSTIGTGEQPGLAKIAPDGRSLVVSNRGSGSVSIYEIEAAAKPRFRATFDGCSGATDIAILGDSSKAFVACSGGSEVLSISLASAPDSWAAKQDPASLQDHLLVRLRVGKSPVHLALKPDNGELFVSNFGSDSVSEVSTFTNEVGGTYKIGSQPSQGLVSADNGTLWVSDFGAESVSLYSIDEGRMMNSVHTGPQPDAMAMSPQQPVLLVANAKSGDVAVIRTRDNNGPELLTMLPAGAQPNAIAIKAFQVR